MTGKLANKIAYMILSGRDGKPYHRCIELIQEQAVLIALQEAGGMGSKAAKVMGVNRTTLVEMRRRMGLKLRGVPNPRTH